MKIIKSSCGKDILVDDEDYPLLSRHVWFVPESGYAFTCIGSKQISMHSLVNGAKKSAHVTDHINRNKLDNRRENLRSVTVALNALNRGKAKSVKVHYKSNYVGAFYKKEGNSERYEAGLSVNNYYFYLGRFKTDVEAAKYRDAFAYMVHGHNAYLNFPELIDEYKTYVFPERIMKRYRERV